MAPPDLSSVAQSAVAAAARVTRAVQCDLDRVQKLTKDDRSPVTVADFAVQAIVSLALGEADPRIKIVGEEHAGHLRMPEQAAIRSAVIQAVHLERPECDETRILDAIDACSHDATSDDFWALDPIDGTKGFLRGGQYAIALARIVEGRVTYGLLGCPNLSPDRARSVEHPAEGGVIVTATLGKGCIEVDLSARGGKPRPLRWPAAPPPGPLRFCRSVEKAHGSVSDTQRVLEQLGGEHVSLRLDSQAKYAVVARGQADAYLRMPVNATYRESIWDHAAGMIVAAEAGAVVTDIAGKRLDFSRGRRLEDNRGIVAARADLHPRLMEAISAIGLSDAASPLARS